jgi:hypothetical protein
MIGLRRLASSVKGALWLVRGADLRGQVERLEHQLAALTGSCLRKAQQELRPLFVDHVGPVQQPA